MTVLFLDWEKTGCQYTTDIKINVKRETNYSFKYAVFKLLLMSSLHLNRAFTLQQVYTVRTKHQPCKESLRKEPQTLYFSPWTVIPFIMEDKNDFSATFTGERKDHD